MGEKCPRGVRSVKFYKIWSSMVIKPRSVPLRVSFAHVRLFFFSFFFFFFFFGGGDFFVFDSFMDHSFLTYQKVIG